MNFQTELIENESIEDNSKFLLPIKNDIYLWNYQEDFDFLRKIKLSDNPSLINHFTITGKGGTYYPKNGSSNLYFFFSNQDLVILYQTVKAELIEKMLKFNNVDITKNTLFQIVKKNKTVTYEDEFYQEHIATFNNLDNVCMISAMFIKKFLQGIQIKILKSNYTYIVPFK